MTTAEPTPPDSNAPPPTSVAKQSRRAARAAPKRTVAKPAKQAVRAKGAKAPRAKAKGAKRTRVGKSGARKAKAAMPAKVRLLKAGPRRVKAPAPMVWEVVPDPVPPMAIDTTGAPAAPAPILVAKPKHTVGKVLLIGALVIALAVMGVATQVTSEPNTGTIKVHDGAAADPPQRNEPHVEGDFFVEGFNMAADSGDLFIFAAPPTGDGELVLETVWEADDGEPAFHFLEGPFELPCGHYRVGVSNGDADPEDFPGGMKKKAFWVEAEPGESCEPAPPECGEPGAPPCPEEPECGEPGAPPCPPPECGEPGAPPCPEEPECGEPGAPPCPEEPAEIVCPTDLLAVANSDGSVQLAWTVATGSDGTNVYRADGDGDFEYVTTTAAGVEGYLDTTTVVGQSYAYMVTGLYGDEESEGCEVVETTAIPEFPTSLGLSLATVGGVVALALAGRRKA